MKKTMLLAGLVVVLVAGCDNKPAIPPMPEVNGQPYLIHLFGKLFRFHIGLKSVNGFQFIDGAAGKAQPSAG